jgi:integrase
MKLSVVHPLPAPPAEAPLPPRPNGSPLRDETGRSLLGSVEPHRGRWRVRFRVAGKLTTISTHATYDEAELARLSYAAAIRPGDEGGLTVAAYGYAVIDARELDGTTGDGTNERSRWKNHVEGDRTEDKRGRAGPGIGALPMMELEEDDVLAWMKRVRGKGLKEGTQRHCLHLMMAVWRAAYADKPRRHQGPNPCANVVIKRDRRTHDPEVFLTVDQQDRLVAAAREVVGCEEAIVDFAIGSGLRGGEIVPLKLEDVHLDAQPPYIDVRYSVEAGRPTKSGKPRRVYLLGKDRAALERWLAVLPTFCPSNPLGLVFPGQRGGMRSHDHVLRWSEWKGFKQRGKPGDPNYRARIVGLVERAGVPPELRWHDLRHTCASSLLNGWWGSVWTLPELQKRLGHSDPETTLRYAHVAEDAQKKAAERTLLFRSPDRSPLAVTARDPYVDQAVPKPKVTGPNPVSRSSDIVEENGTRLAAMGNGWGTARALLAAVERRADEGEVAALAEELASTVLGSEAVKLAREIMRQGPRALTAAIELAQLLGSDEGEEGRSAAGGT